MCQVKDEIDTESNTIYIDGCYTQSECMAYKNSRVRRSFQADCVEMSPERYRKQSRAHSTSTDSRAGKVRSPDDAAGAISCAV